MTRLEQQTLEKLNLKIENYIQSDVAWKTDDKKWKDSVDDWKERLVQPILDESAKKTVITVWIREQIAFLVKIVAFMGTVGLVFHYLIGPILGWKI